MKRNKSWKNWSALIGFTIAIFAAIVASQWLPSAAAIHPTVVFVNLTDTGKTVTLKTGEELMVKLPMRDYNDNSWHISKVSPSLKLVAGPDELRPIHWSPWTVSWQVFYFKRVAPGTADLVMEPNYFLKPLVLKVTD